MRIGTLLVLGAFLALSGCAAPSRPLWRAGASRVGYEGTPVELPKPPSEIATHYKEAFGPFDPTQRRRHYACGSTTVLTKAFLLEHDRAAPAPEGYQVVADLTTEEYPRDEERSFLLPPFFELILGAGVAPHDLFEVRLDPAWRDAAVRRLQAFAAQLGADAVIEIYATGAAEYHMWEGSGIGLDVRETNSPVYASGKLLGLRLRDVRLHGRAVRYE